MAFLHLTQRIPKRVCVALSGGIDSMVGLDFCIRNSIEVTALHFNHGTANSEKYESFVRSRCLEMNIPIFVGKIDDPKIPKKRSAEDYWREKRYEFLREGSKGLPVVTCHHLNDAVETWIFSSLKGNPKVMPYKRDIYIRPFLLNDKDKIISWANKNDVSFVEDTTNKDTSFDRNYIRNVLMPHALRINPGIFKTVKKKIINKIKLDKEN